MNMSTVPLWRSRARCTIPGLTSLQIQTSDNENPVQTANRMRSMIGYHIAYEHNLIGMAMTQGRQRDVVNIGIGIKQINSPAGMSVVDLAISHHHKV